MLVAHYLDLLHRSKEQLAAALREIGEAHAEEPDVHSICRKLASDADRHAEQLKPLVDRYGEDTDEPDRLHSELFEGARSGPLGLLRDLHDLYLMATECDITWTLLGQAAQGLRHHDLLEVVRSCEGDTTVHLSWLKTRMKAAAPQTLVVSG